MSVLKSAAVAGSLFFLCLSSVASLAADPVQGEALFKRFCRACHTVEGTQNKVGPYLEGLWERPVGSAEGYRYSKAFEAFAEEQGRWDDAQLEAFLINPREVVKGTRMTFFGVRNEAAARDISAYLKGLGRVD